jgi:hypothetical protein
LAAHDPYAVNHGLLGEVLKQKAAGASDDDIVEWLTGFGEAIGTAPGEVELHAALAKGPSIAALSSSTAPAPMDDRAQLALLGFRSREEIAADARTASLEECAELGREHGAADASENVALIAAGERTEEEVNAFQTTRALRRINNLRTAGLDDAQLRAYSEAASGAFKAVLAAVVGDSAVAGDSAEPAPA